MRNINESREFLAEASLRFGRYRANRNINKAIKASRGLQYADSKFNKEMSIDKGSTDAAQARLKAEKMADKWYDASTRVTKRHGKNIDLMASRISRNEAKYGRKYAKYKNDPLLKDRLAQIDNMKKGYFDVSEKKETEKRTADPVKKEVKTEPAKPYVDAAQEIYKKFRGNSATEGVDMGYSEIIFNENINTTHLEESYNTSEILALLESTIDNISDIDVDVLHSLIEDLGYEYIEEGKVWNQVKKSGPVIKKAGKNLLTTAVVGSTMLPWGISAKNSHDAMNVSKNLQTSEVAASRDNMDKSIKTSADAAAQLSHFVTLPDLGGEYGKTQMTQIAEKTKKAQELKDQAGRHDKLAGEFKADAKRAKTERLVNSVGGAATGGVAAAALAAAELALKKKKQTEAEATTKNIGGNN